MQPELCTTCSQQFYVADTDKAFYAKFGLPEPAMCPQCRSQKRLAFRNERTLYKRKCDLCHKSMISIYGDSKPYPVYCQDCFWSDKWNPLEHGLEFDFDKPFFEQFAKLLKTTPRLGIVNKQSHNSDYCNYSFSNKNCYLTFGNHYEEDCIYGHYSTKNRSCVDYLQLYESELCYQCLFSKKCYKSVWLDHSENCQDCWFSVDLKSCEHCFLCSNLRHKKFHILNKPYSKEEYNKKIKEFDFVETENFYKKEFRTKFPFRSYYQANCENCQGNNLQNSKKLNYCFDCAGCEDCAYGFQMDETYDSMDMNCMGYDKSEICYQTIGCSGIYNCVTCDSCWHGSDLKYCNLCFSSKNLFGCIGLNRKEYCILNKQYSHEEYDALAKRIVEHMKQTKEWGEFFPSEISPFEYFETVANEYYPMETDHKKVRERDEKAYKCIFCGQSFRTIPQELKLYEKIGVPVPKKCPDCRHRDRIALRNPRALWSRKCAKCGCDIWTSYSPDRTESVYCEKCYLGEVY